jgi:hypothetical protein
MAFRILTLFRSPKAAAGFPFVGNFGPGLPSMDRRTDSHSFSRGTAPGAAVLQGSAIKSVSGDRGSARLKGDAGGVRVNELRVDGAVEKFYRLRKHQQLRRRRKQHRVGHGDNGADRAAIVRLPVWIMVGRRLLPVRGLTSGVSEAAVGSVWLLRQAGLNRGGSLRDSVEMPERQRKLDDQRQQREPSSMFDIRPEPLHADMHPTSEGRRESAGPIQCYIITSGISGCCQPHCGRVSKDFVRPV